MLTLALALVLTHAGPSPPVVRGPRSTTSPHPVYHFVSREPGVRPARIRFRCSFDRPRLHACRSRYSQRLRVGRHLLRAQAVDPAGRRSRVRAVRVTILAAGGPHVTRIQVGGHPFSLVDADGSIWVANFLSGTVQRIDPATNSVTANIQVGGQPYGITAGGGSVWVGNNALDSVAKIDAASNRVVARITTGDRPLGLAYDATDHSVWVADYGDQAVAHVDAVTDAVLARAVIPGAHEDVVLGFGSVWIPSEERTLIRLDPATLAVTAAIQVAPDPDFALVAAGSVWTTAYAGNVISRIDPATNTVAATLPVHFGLQGLAFDGSDFWAAGYDENRLFRLDPADGHIRAERQVDGGPRDVLFADGSIWVASSTAPTVLRFSPVP